MIKYLHWKWYDWLLTLPMVLWVIVVSMIMSPAIVTECMIVMVPRMIRETRFYERHDFGIIEDSKDSTTLDDMDYKALEEMEEKQVLGNFLYKSKMVKVWLTLISFHKAGELR